MDWWLRLRERLTGAAPAATSDGDAHSVQAAQSVRALLDDTHIPPAIRLNLSADFARLESMLGKLERGELHIAVFGRVSVGK